MDSCIQILCRFQKCKQKVPPPSPLKNQPWGTKRKNLKKNLRGDGGVTFRLHFWNLHKIWFLDIFFESFPTLKQSNSKRVRKLEEKGRVSGI